MKKLPQVASAPIDAKEARFTLRDDNAQHYHRSIPTANSPIFVRLAWRASKAAPVFPIGLFRLDLPELLRAGYIRREQPADPDQVRVRFYRSDDGMIYLQARTDGPRLAVASAPI